MPARPGWASFHGGHSHFGDGRGTVAEIAQSAAERGLTAFGFTEHFPAPPHQEFSPDGIVPGLVERSADWVGRYVAEVRGVQKQFQGQIELLLGAEIEYIAGAESWTRDRLAGHTFDYLVGSVHYVRYGEFDICIDWDRPRVHEALRRAGSVEQFCLDYYDHVLGLLDWGLVHVLGHLDLVKIFLRSDEPTDTPAVRTRVRKVLQAMRERSVALDVNARGLVKPCRAVYPADWILEEACRLTVPVTLGDDSHAPSEVGVGLDQAVAALRRAGYQSMALVRPGGSLEPVPLPD